ncbi:9935_t:CDS:2, partial [Acaulospora colombiana]
MVIANEWEENAAKRLSYFYERRIINEDLRYRLGNEGGAEQDPSLPNGDVQSLIDEMINAMVRNALDDIIDQAICDEALSQRNVSVCNIAETLDHHLEKGNDVLEETPKENGRLSRTIQGQDLTEPEGEISLSEGESIYTESLLHDDVRQSTNDDPAKVKLAEIGVQHSSGLDLLAEVALADAEINASQTCRFINHEEPHISNSRVFEEFDMDDEYEVLKYFAYTENLDQKSFNEYNYAEKETVAIEDSSSDFLSNPYLGVAANQSLRFDLFPKEAEFNNTELLNHGMDSNNDLDNANELNMTIESGEALGNNVTSTLEVSCSVNDSMRLYDSEERRPHMDEATPENVSQNDQDIDFTPGEGEIQESSIVSTENCMVDSNCAAQKEITLSNDENAQCHIQLPNDEVPCHILSSNDDNVSCPVHSSDDDGVSCHVHPSNDTNFLPHTHSPDDMNIPRHVRFPNGENVPHHTHTPNDKNISRNVHSSNDENVLFHIRSPNDENVQCHVDSSNDENKLDESPKQDFVKSENRGPTSKIPQGRVIVTRSIASSSKDATSHMSLEEKKRLLKEVRHKKMMIKSNFQKSDLGKITRENTERNKEYRCELDVVVVRKDGPKPLSPTSKMQEKMRSGGRSLSSHLIANCKDKPKTSYIPVLKSRGMQKENEKEVAGKYVRWDEDLLQVSSPQVKSSPSVARQKPTPKSCLKPTNPVTDSLGNILNANESLTPT